MSKTLEFTKMHGCGNDYIYFDCFDGEPEYPEELSRVLSDRHFSVGGDGIILVCKSDKADGKMRIFNADGSEAMMCGNGVRCVGKFLHDIKGIDKDVITVDTLSGVKILQMFTDDNGRATGAEVDMGKAILDPNEIPVDLPADESGEVMNREIDISGESYRISCVSMGNPHCVVFGGDPDQLNLPVIGPKFENDPIFPNRVNTEFIEVIDDHTLKMRVWERGSGETLACGTGACASVVAAVRNGYCQENEYVKVILKGGELEIRYMDDGEVFMKGPAEIAFTGSVEVDL